MELYDFATMASDLGTIVGQEYTLQFWHSVVYKTFVLAHCTLIFEEGADKFYLIKQSKIIWHNITSTAFFNSPKACLWYWFSSLFECTRD